MMEFTYDLLEPGANQEESLERLTKIFAPLHAEAWTQKQDFAPYDMNVGAFVNMWLSNTLRIFIAYDRQGTPQGYLTGILFRPLTRRVNAFHIEDWYVRGGGIGEDKLFEHVYSVLKYMGIDELRVSHEMGRPVPAPTGWVALDATTTQVFRKV